MMGRMIEVLEQMHQIVPQRNIVIFFALDRETGMWSYPPAAEVLDTTDIMKLRE